MAVVEVSNISKTFGNSRVVNDVSFTVQKREILGMVGPNGAGKTTTIRMLMDIIKPDSGEIRILSQKLNEATKDIIGYLPEDRGLYKKLKVSECLSYLASIKNVPANIAENNADSLLKRTGMFQHRNKKIEELSKGMSQLIQFAATIIHDPMLIVLDEPFAGLDPVNTRLIKDIIGELRERDKCIILSTHLMNQVEELCDRVLMISKGNAVLYDSLSNIKAKYRNNSIIFEGGSLPQAIPGVISKRRQGSLYEIFLDEKMEPQQVLSFLISNSVQITRFELSTPSLNEIFIKFAEQTQ